MAEQLGVQLLQPKTVSVDLPSTQVTTSVTTISIRESLYSLFCDPSLMTDDNLLFNGDSPFDPPSFQVPVPDNHVYDDINTGAVYYYFWNRYCRNIPNKVYLPFIFFIDKTFIDKKGKLNSEPVTFTLGIFKREVRNNNKDAWRSIGLIPDSFSSGLYRLFLMNSNSFKLLAASAGI
jgi:hypothetical protein